MIQSERKFKDDKLATIGREESTKEAIEFETLPLIESVPGYRKTVFSSLVSASFISNDAIKRKIHLEEYFAVRVDPKIVQIYDYLPGESISVSLYVKNFSRNVQRITLHPPKTNKFRFHKDTPLLEMNISPGLEKEIKIVFDAPLSSLEDLNVSSNRNHLEPKQHFRLYTDVIKIDILKGRQLSIPLEAFPAGPQIEFDPLIDFGFVIQEPLSKTPIVYDLMVYNRGKRQGSFTWTFDSKSSISVYPTSFTLNPDSQMSVRIEYFPKKAGFFSTKLLLVPEIQVPTPTNRAAALNENSLPLKITANVFQHKLRIRNGPGYKDLDPSHLDFGNVFCCQNVSMEVKLENRSPDVLKWVLFYSDERLPLVPSIKNSGEFTEESLVNSQSTKKDDRAAIVAEPSEGILEPFQSSKIIFRLCPEIPPPTLGFKKNKAEQPIKSYKVPMTLKIIDSSALNSCKLESAPGESPIDLTLTAQACPLKLKLSKEHLDFKVVNEGKNATEELILTNTSDLLGCCFKIKKMPHFTITPSQGKLGPLETIQFQVNFTPKQLGELHYDLNIKIFDYSSETKVMKPEKTKAVLALNGRYVLKEEIPDMNVISILNLKLTGICSPKSLEDSVSESLLQLNKALSFDEKSLEEYSKNLFALKSVSKRAKENPILNQEWEEKTHHRHLYAAYLRASRSKRIQVKNSDFFGTDSIPDEQKGIFPSYDSLLLDIETGLKAPEPFKTLDGDEKKMTLKEHENENLQAKKLKELLQKLNDKFAHVSLIHLEDLSVLEIAIFDIGPLLIK